MCTTPGSDGVFPHHLGEDVPETLDPQDHCVFPRRSLDTLYSAPFPYRLRMLMALAQEKHLPASQSVVESLRLFSDPSLATSETTSELPFLQKLFPDNDEHGSMNHVFSATLGRSEVSFSARSSRYLTMSLPSLSSAFPRSGAYTVPRLRRLLQMVAVVGWLQRISSRSEEGRASSPGRRGESSRSSEGRVLGPRIG